MTLWNSLQNKGYKVLNSDLENNNNYQSLDQVSATPGIALPALASSDIDIDTKEQIEDLDDTTALLNRLAMTQHTDLDLDMNSDSIEFHTMKSSSSSPSSISHVSSSTSSLEKPHVSNGESKPPVIESVADIISNPTKIFRVILAGTGFMCDAYDLFIINLVMVAITYQQESKDVKPSHYQTGLVATGVLVGSVVGQLIFGVLADRIGRRKGFIATLTILFIGAVLSAASIPDSTASLLYSLAAFRFILGVGIGGEYPLAATVSSEASIADNSKRGQRISVVFSMQGVGMTLAPLVFFILVHICGDNYDLAWRLALGLGGLPAIIMLYPRFRMKETDAFTRAERHNKKEHFLRIWEHRSSLLACAGSWFIFDVIFYSQSLFSAQILNEWYPDPDVNDKDAVHTHLADVAASTLYLALLALPGYLCGTLLVDRIGRRKLQLLGFTGMIVFYVLIGGLMSYLRDYQALFYILYGLSFFFCNCGPNVTTFVMPAEAFPTSIRATCHGLSAAIGKVGAVVGGYLMPALLSAFSLSTVMYVSAAISFVGFVFTVFFVPETMHLQLVPEIEVSTQTSKPSASSVELDTVV